jgi:hypothetical protein
MSSNHSLSHKQLRLLLETGTEGPGWGGGCASGATLHKTFILVAGLCSSCPDPEALRGENISYVHRHHGNQERRAQEEGECGEFRLTIKHGKAETHPYRRITTGKTGKDYSRYSTVQESELEK